MIYIVALLLIMAIIFEAMFLKKGLKSAKKNAAYLRSEHTASSSSSRPNKRVKPSTAAVPLSETPKDEEPAIEHAESVRNIIEFPERGHIDNESSLSEELRYASEPAPQEKSVHDIIQEIRGSSEPPKMSIDVLGEPPLDEYEEVVESDEYEEVVEYEELPIEEEAGEEKSIPQESHDSPALDATIEEAKATALPEADNALGAAPTKIDHLEEAEIVPSAEELLKDGIRFVRQGKLDEGIVALEQAAASAPEKAEAHFNLGIAYTLQEFHSSAVHSYQKAITLDPQYGKAFYNLGTLYLKQGNAKDAIEKLEQAVKFLSDPMKALWNLYEAYRGSESFSHALSTLERLIALEPDDASLYNHLGICYVKLGKYPEAIEAWQRSVSLGASSRLIFYNLGKTYELCDQPDDAIEQYQYFLQLNSNSSNWEELKEEVQERLENLQGVLE